MAKKIQVEFKDINIGEEKQIPRPDQVRHLSKVQEFQIGRGTNVWRANRQGMWLGAEKFEDAPFSVSMTGEVVGISFEGTTLTGITINGSTINGGTIVGSIFKTAASGVRIEIDSPNDANEIRFYEDTDLYATLLVRKDGSDGLIEIVDPDGAGFRLTSGVGASGFGAASLISIGGQISTSGNATSGFNGLIGNGDKYVAMIHSAAGDALLVSNALPTSDPSLLGAFWNDGGTVKVSAG